MIDGLFNRYFVRTGDESVAVFVARHAVEFTQFVHIGDGWAWMSSFDGGRILRREQQSYVS